MATLSILGYGLTQGVTTLNKSPNNNMSTNGASSNQQEGVNLTKTFTKITVQNVLSENNRNSINISNNSSNNSPTLNSSNAIVRKIKDFGMVGAVNNAAGANSGNATNCVSKSLLIRKRPLMDTTKNNSNENNKSTPPATIPKKSKSSKEIKEPKEESTTKAPKKLNNENVANRPKKVANAVNNATNGGTVKPAGTPGRKGLPLPQAVARRNARERNRVKQVNNGFAALRERIPEEVAEAFETQSTGRNSSIKKLSKVETLRMAVEYIRSLERLLGFDFPIEGREGRDSMAQQYSGSSGDDSYSLIKDEFDAMSPNMEDNFEDSISHYDMDDYFSTSTNRSTAGVPQTDLSDATNQFDLLPNITTLHGLQYIRIPGTNTYQLLTPDIFVGTTHSPPNSCLDDEQFSPLIDTNRRSPAAIGLTSPAQATNQINTQILTAMPATSASTSTSTTAPRTTETALTAPASPNASTATNGKPVAVSLSRLTPVPQIFPTTTSTPNVGSSSSSSLSSSSLYQQRPQTTEPKLSPAVNEPSSQACATEMQAQFVAPNLPHLLPHLIKQEYVEALDFDSSTKSPNAITMNNVYQTAAGAAGDQREHATISMSPPLDRCNRLLIAPQQHQHTTTIELQSFYEPEDSGSFYDNNLSFKKDLDDVLLDASSATNTGLSDESMIEAIDWWEAHTPQSDGGSAVML